MKIMPTDSGTRVPKTGYHVCSLIIGVPLLPDDDTSQNVRTSKESQAAAERGQRPMSCDNIGVTSMFTGHPKLTQQTSKALTLFKSYDYEVVDLFL